MTDSITQPPNPFGEDLAERIAQGLRRLEWNCRELASLGWTVPTWATPGEVDEVMQDVRRDGADDVLVRLYSTEWSSALDEMRDETLGNPMLKPWSPLLSECWAAYAQQLYKVCIPSLITVLEGLLAARAGLLRAWCKPTQVTAKAVNESLPDSVSRVIEQSIADFVGLVFQSKDFSGDRPVLLNRHWVAHGRDVADWSQADALRLLHALATVARTCRSTDPDESDGTDQPIEDGDPADR